MTILTLSNCQLRPSEGSGQIILALTEGLRARGHEVDLFGPDDYEVLRWMRPRANSYRQTLGMRRFALRTLARKEYDVREIYGGEGWLTLASLRRTGGGRPLLVSHSNGLESHHHETLASSGHSRRRWWQVDHGELMYGGKEFYAVVGSGQACLEVVLESLNAVEERKKVLPGVTLPGK